MNCDSPPAEHFRHEPGSAPWMVLPEAVKSNSSWVLTLRLILSRLAGQPLQEASTWGWIYIVITSVYLMSPINQRSRFLPWQLLILQIIFCCFRSCFRYIRVSLSGLWCWILCDQFRYEFLGSILSFGFFQVVCGIKSVENIYLSSPNFFPMIFDMRHALSRSPSNS